MTHTLIFILIPLFIFEKLRKISKAFRIYPISHVLLEPTLHRDVISLRNRHYPLDHWSMDKRNSVVGLNPSLTSRL
jgi:hypothetical protein